MPVKQMKELLDKNGIKYVTIRHSLAYTAQEIAASAHVKGKEMAKTVIVKTDGKMVMAVLPASYKLDRALLRKAAGGTTVELAAEDEFENKFPGCEIGAMPPFGNLYGMEVFADEDLSRDEEIAFNAGSHAELIKMKYEDFTKLVKPKVLKIAFMPESAGRDYSRAGI